MRRFSLQVHEKVKEGGGETKLGMPPIQNMSLAAGSSPGIP